MCWEKHVFLWTHESWEYIKRSQQAKSPWSQGDHNSCKNVLWEGKSWSIKNYSALCLSRTGKCVVLCFRVDKRIMLLIYICLAKRNHTVIVLIMTCPQPSLSLWRKRESTGGKVKKQGLMGRESLPRSCHAFLVNIQYDIERRLGTSQILIFNCTRHCSHSQLSFTSLNTIVSIRAAFWTVH